MTRTTLRTALIIAVLIAAIILINTPGCESESPVTVELVDCYLGSDLPTDLDNL